MDSVEVFGLPITQAASTNQSFTNDIPREKSEELPPCHGPTCLGVRTTEERLVDSEPNLQNKQRPMFDDEESY